MYQLLCFTPQAYRGNVPSSREGCRLLSLPFHKCYGSYPFRRLSRYTCEVLFRQREQPSTDTYRDRDYILRNENVELLNVFIYAPTEARVKRIMERMNVNEQQALQLIKKNDKQRKCYYDFYTDKKWASHSSYDLNIDSSRFDIDRIVEIIAKAIE